MTRLQLLRQLRSDAIKPELDAHRLRVAACCPECGGLYLDGFTIGCETCSDRAGSVNRRVREGQGVRPGLADLARRFKLDCADELRGHAGRYDSIRQGRAVA